jgi:hypothetical protein
MLESFKSGLQLRACTTRAKCRLPFASLVPISFGMHLLRVHSCKPCIDTAIVGESICREITIRGPNVQMRSKLECTRARLPVSPETAHITNRDRARARAAVRRRGGAGGAGPVRGRSCAAAGAGARASPGRGGGAAGAAAGGGPGRVPPAGGR